MLPRSKVIPLGRSRVIPVVLAGNDLMRTNDLYKQKVLGVQRSNLLAYLPLDGNTIDISGHGFNGLASNISYLPGIGDGGQAAAFTGSGICNINFFSAALAAAFNGAEGSSAVWASITTAATWADGTYDDVIYFYADANNYVIFDKSSTVNNTYIARIGATILENRQDTVGPTTAFFHMGITWSESADKVIYYINGVPTETDTVLGAWGGAVLTRALIGSASITGGTWKGRIAHVGLWNAPLSGANMLTLAKV